MRGIQAPAVRTRAGELTLHEPHHHRDALLDQLFPEESEGSVYAVLDGARDEAIHAEVEAASNTSACLFRGAPPVLEVAAPWLVTLGSTADAFSEWLIEHGFGKSWGLFAVTEAPFKAVRKHFRQFLRVKGSGGKPMFFRYYDPRVWRTFLPACDPTELAFLFGPVSAYFVEGVDPNVLIRFQLGPEGKLLREEVRLVELQPDPAELAAQLRDQALGEKDPQARSEALLRARLALADAPGAAALLAFVGAFASEYHADHAVAAAALKAELERPPDELSAEALREACQRYPEVESWESSYATLAPSCQGWLGREARQNLRERCEELIHMGQAITEVRALREHLRALSESGADEETQVGAVVVAIEDLKRLEGRLATTPLPPESPVVAAFTTGLARLNKRLGFRRKPKPRAAIAGISSLLVSVKANSGRGEDGKVAALAKGILHALESTSPPIGASCS